ncbi:MAG TPA: tetratricopeptide repeat protein [Candidatus Binataceae bacterium]|nr:tetratricopeptide repeat protein [Candidatus Binataceae bacterium]
MSAGDPANAGSHSIADGSADFRGWLRDQRLWLLAITVVTGLAYSRSLGDELNEDVRQFVLYNPHMADWPAILKSLIHSEAWLNDPSHPFQSSYYRPMVNLWMALNFNAFGAHPAGWHASIIVLHLLVVWLTWRVASLLTGNKWTALLTAALFALTPIHAEAVASAMGSPLTAAFELAAFAAYLSASNNSGSHAESMRRKWHALSLILYGLALLAYESAAVFPALIAADVMLLSTRSFTIPDRIRAGIVAACPFAIEVAAYLVLRTYALGFITQSNPFAAHPMTGLQAVLTLPAAILNYATLLLMPWRASPAHRLAIAQSIGSRNFLLPAAELAILSCAGFVLLRRHEHRRLYLFCAAWTLISLAPVLNLGGLLVTTPSALIQDRYLYLPSFGFCLMAADLAVDFARTSTAAMTAVPIGIAAVATAYVISLQSVQSFWHDDAATLARSVEEAPDATVWRFRLGHELLSRNNVAGALDEFRAVVAIDPADGAAYYDLALIYERSGDFRAATDALKNAGEKIKNPTADQLAKFALAADAAGDSKAADGYLKRAQSLDDGTGAVAMARAQLSFRHGDVAGAEKILRDLIQTDPANTLALTGLGALLSTQHRFDDALAAYRRATAITPNDPIPHYLAALALHRVGRDAEAREQCSIALTAAPANPDIQALMVEIERTSAAHQ